MAGRRRQYKKLAKLNLSLDESLKEFVDKRAYEEGLSMTGYVQKLIQEDRRHILQEETPCNPKTIPAPTPAAPAASNIIRPGKPKYSGGAPRAKKKASS